jgi:hypothetical protein
MTAHSGHQLPLPPSRQRNLQVRFQSVTASDGDEIKEQDRILYNPGPQPPCKQLKRHGHDNQLETWDLLQK